jgi:small conductance mechanosensitive channel
MGDRFIRRVRDGGRGWFSVRYVCDEAKLGSGGTRRFLGFLCASWQNRGMDKHATLDRLRSLVLLAIVVALPLSFEAKVLGQEAPSREGSSAETTAQRAREALEDLKARQTELDELRAELREAGDMAAVAPVRKELSERRGRYRRSLANLVVLVQEGEDAGAEIAFARTAAIELLTQDAKSMQEKLDSLSLRAIEYLETISKGSAEEARQARHDFGELLRQANRLLEYFDSNIDQRSALGEDVIAITEHLEGRLQSRADGFAGLLRETKENIDALDAKPGLDQDPSAQEELVSLRKYRDVLAESQRLTVRLMDKHGMETAELRQGIIRATGRLSQDVLDREVATGLIEQSLADARAWLQNNGSGLVFGALTFLLVLVGFWVIARVARAAVRRGLDRSKMRVSTLARDFFVKSTGRLIMLIGLIIAIAQLGIEIGPLLAGLGIAGFVIGFALQDTLSNFASGMMILAYRPYDVGDAIEAGGVIGSVSQMNLVSTMIMTFDNQLLVVPNNKIWGDVIRNITNQETRRIDMTFGIGYSDDIANAERVLTDIVTSHEKILEDPAPMIRLHELSDSSMNFVVRPWAKTSDYWDVYWDVTREVKRRFDAEGISIPFPQRDVHIYHDDVSREPRKQAEAEVS